ncbi:unnamed protein product [Knipowitschia caucasica]
MVDSCCEPGCTNHRGQGKARAFYRIPKDPARREKWISAIKRAQSTLKKTEHWIPSPNGFRLCSDHFITGKKSDNPLSPDYVPSVFRHVPSPVKKKGKMLMDTFSRRQAAKKRKQQETPEAPMGPFIPPGESSDTLGQHMTVSLLPDPPLSETTMNQSFL